MTPKTIDSQPPMFKEQSHASFHFSDHFGDTPFFVPARIDDDGQNVEMTRESTGHSHVMKSNGNIYGNLSNSFSSVFCELTAYFTRMLKVASRFIGQIFGVQQLVFVLAFQFLDKTLNWLLVSVVDAWQSIRETIVAAIPVEIRHAFDEGKHSAILMTCSTLYYLFGSTKSDTSRDSKKSS